MKINCNCMYLVEVILTVKYFWCLWINGIIYKFSRGFRANEDYLQDWHINESTIPELYLKQENRKFNTYLTCGIFVLLLKEYFGTDCCCLKSFNWSLNLSNLIILLNRKLLFTAIFFLQEIYQRFDRVHFKKHMQSIYLVEEKYNLISLNFSSTAWKFRTR